MKVTTIRTKVFLRLSSLILKRLGVNVSANSRHNGELRLLKEIASAGLCEGETVLFDVGANKGGYTELLMTAFPNPIVHAFEPGPDAFRELDARHGNNPKVHLNNVGCSSSSGALTLYSDYPGSSLASIYQRNLEHVGVSLSHAGSVSVITIDEYCEARGIRRIAFLKIDVEGHELEVIKGAQRIMAKDCVDMIQLEFGGCNIDSRTYMKDFWLLLSNRYDFFRITPHGLSPIERYTEAQELFGYQNIFLIRKGHGKNL